MFLISWCLACPFITLAYLFLFFMIMDSLTKLLFENLAYNLVKCQRVKVCLF